MLRLYGTEFPVEILITVIFWIITGLVSKKSVPIALFKCKISKDQSYFWCQIVSKSNYL